MRPPVNNGFSEKGEDFTPSGSGEQSHSAPVSVVVGEGGRLVIPAEMRKKMGVIPGDTVAVRLEAGGLRVVSAKQALEEIRRIARKSKAPGISEVDAFLADRREAQRRSDERFDRLEREAAEIAAERARRG